MDCKYTQNSRTGLYFTIPQKMLIFVGYNEY